MKLNIKNNFSTELPSDPILENTRRQVSGACFSFVEPKKTAKPELIHASTAMGEAIGLSAEELDSKIFLNVFSGNKILENTKPYAMCYGGHQFGNWAGQLGDGRAINLTEVTHNGENWALQLKGAGPTPYSRTADGLAVLRSSIREYLCSEAMHYLRVPTTRALSISLTGDKVWRDMLYDGNAAYEKGAVVCRAASSFVRFGNFEFFAAHEDLDNLKKLTDYSIKHFYPDYNSETKDGYLGFFKAVTQNTLQMIIHWQRVGFVHGVMNTDNMSILGLTIDYGPYGWLEGYDHGWTPNTTDSENKRYRYANQANIGLWNLLKLANALFPLIDDVAALESVLDQYKVDYEREYLKMMKSKIGLFTMHEDDQAFLYQLEELLHLTETDMTIFFRNLSHFKKENPLSETDDTTFFGTAIDAFYTPKDLKENILAKWKDWFITYHSRLQQEILTDTERSSKMNTINPKYVLRNYMAQLAIDAANTNDFSIVDELFSLLQNPYDEQRKSEKWFAKRPEWARNKIGCSSLSCSS